MPGTAGLEILATVERGDTIADLAASLDRSESYVSRAVSELDAAGLVNTERDGRRKRVTASDARAVELYRDLARQYPHVEFAELLTDRSLEVLYCFDRPSTVAELAERSGNYRNTVNRVAKRLRDRGLVGNDGGEYRFNDDFDRLHEFARELAHHRNRRRLESVAPGGTILWQTADEFLAQTDSDVDASSFHETGLARFREYGLQFLLTRHRYYYYAEGLDDLSPSDLCCHTLLIDDDSRHRSYCLLLLSTVDVDRETLRERASRYGLEEPIDDLLRYLETNGGDRGDRLPTWPEFRELADEYGVAT